MSEVDDVIREIFILDESDDIYVELNTNDVCQYDTAVQVVEALLPDHKKLAAARAVLAEYPKIKHTMKYACEDMESGNEPTSDVVELICDVAIKLINALEAGDE